MRPERGGGQVRIIGGRLRGRKLLFRDQVGLRPTGDRIRETLFNWLQPLIPGARCLDLFAGSGALGFEAASRGAAEVVMVERAPGVAQDLRANLERLGATEVTLVQADALRLLEQPGAPFDLVLLDPPFAAGLLEVCCARLSAKGWLRPGALVYVETDAAAGLPNLPEAWRWLHRKSSGQVAYGLAQLVPAAKDDRAASLGSAE